MTLETKQLTDGLANAALNKYAFDCVEVEMLELSENATYLVKEKSTGKIVNVMRICRPGYHTTEELESEINWINELKSCNQFNVASPVKGKDGGYIQSVYGNDKNKYHCIVSEFMAGKAPDRQDMPSLFEKLGKITAVLHRQTMEWDSVSSIKRVKWDYDTIIGDNAIWGKWQDFEGMTEKYKEILSQTAAVIKKRLDIYGKTRQNYGLIHGDLRLANLLVKDEKICILDFDDCGFGWHLQDLAASISFIETDENTPQLVSAWLDGYQSETALSQRDLDETDTFIMLRRMQLTAWLGSRKESDPAASYSVGWLEKTVQLAVKYLDKYYKCF
jgi:Ser/Thr protein kinase RdoA (MazF antagonist)